MKKLLIVTLLALILGACTAQTEKIVETVAPEKIIENVVIEITPTPEIIYEANTEQVDSYTDRMFDKGYHCELGISKIDLTIPKADTGNFTLDLLTNPKTALNSLKVCMDELAEFEVPEYCEECTDLDVKVQEYIRLNIEARELITKGHATLSQETLTKGLENRWDADELWKEIRLDVVEVREVYELEPLW